jgi:hypothetical protein
MDETMFDGHCMTGGVVSRATVTVKVQVSRSRQRLVAVQATVLVPSGKELPDGGLHVIEAVEAQSPLTFGDGKVTFTAFVLQVHTMRLVGQMIFRGFGVCAFSGCANAKRLAWAAIKVRPTARAAGAILRTYFFMFFPSTIRSILWFQGPTRLASRDQ